MTDSNALVEKFRAAYDADESVRERFAADPRGLLAEYGFDIPEGAKCEFVGGDDPVRIAPPEGALDDAQLAGVSGGANPSPNTAAGACLGLGAFIGAPSRRPPAPGSQ